LTCGGAHTFEARNLERSPGAEDESGPAFDALREAFSVFGDGFPEARLLGWILVDQDERGALFLAKVGDHLPRWLAVEVTADSESGEWAPTTMSQCDPHVQLSADFGPATWALDTAYPPPGADTVELNVLVWEQACSGGQPTTGRMSAPVVEFLKETVTITIGVRPIGGFQGCPLPPGTPAIVILPQRLGDRTLLDGGRMPPSEPSPPG
jgi:hypothetical protein